MEAEENLTKERMEELLEKTFDIVGVDLSGLDLAECPGGDWIETVEELDLKEEDDCH